MGHFYHQDLGLEGDAARAFSFLGVFCVTQNVTEGESG